MTGDATTDRVLAALLAMQRQSWEQGVTGHALLGLGELALLVADTAVTRQHRRRHPVPPARAAPRPRGRQPRWMSPRT
ncbi:hypothetical protein [Micromonospora sp. NPDC005305]|uniref:hypothetical protein n=1 Tax=Micromonospora sp. NPDC005305 TaxID=3156875 RepID=UPI0033ACCFC0